MIASINGKVLQTLTNSIVVGVGGIGVQVFIPSPSLEQVRNGDDVFFYTSLIVRQDALSLYGFESNEGREYFNLLLGVDGIGPKVALSIISTLDPQTIRRAVFSEQSDIFCRVPGVGKKTAQKIVLYLHDRLPAVEGLAGISRFSDLDTEVLTALTTLGYSVVEAQAAIQSIPKDAPEDIEVRLRLALTYFAK